MDPARGIRRLHAAMVIGLILVGITFVFLVRVQGHPLSGGGGPLIGYVTAGLALMNLSVVLGFLRPRMPQRRMDQSPDDYWQTNEARGASIIIWAMTEGAGLLAWVGYLLTGGIVPAAVGALSIGGLIMLRPSGLEGDGTV
ncbi:MAG TPA: hypothetical protein VNJ06_14430 [Gemmatimonadales bacterium]|nr:hypothetical protein [Gemmatimonadales bacterium]